MSTLTAAAAATTAHPYPLIRGGGRFLIGIGAGFLLGWIFPKRWVPLAVAGGSAGVVGSGLSALLPSLAGRRRYISPPWPSRSPSRWDSSPWS